MAHNIGVDYSLGQSNIDKSNGIRYGVISQNDVGEAWLNSNEADYGHPTCPKCGEDAVEFNEAEHGEFKQETFFDGTPHGCSDYACLACKMTFDSSNAFSEQALGYSYRSNGYVMLQDGDDTDIFVTKSPYYTFCQFCSPCAPGAGHLGNPMSEGIKTYALGHDWFDNGRAPYPVYQVSDDAEVLPDER